LCLFVRDRAQANYLGATSAPVVLRLY